MTDGTDDGGWGLLGIAGLVSVCCVGLGVVAGGGAVGGTAAGAAGGGGLGPSIATGVVTALTILVVGLALRWRRRS